MDGCGLTTGNTGLDALVLALMPLVTLLVQWLTGKTLPAKPEAKPEVKPAPEPAPSINTDGKQNGPL